MPAASSPFVRSPSASSALGLVVANVVPLVGVLALGWDLFEVMWLYWMENAVIGLYALARILTSGLMGSHPIVWIPKLFVSGFFTVHYGFFWLGHGVFVYALFGDGRESPEFDVGGHIAELASGDLPVEGLIGLVLSHGASFVLNYLAGGEWREADPVSEMFRPYGRVVILHVVIIAGGFLLLATGGGILALALFVVLKTGLDLGIHLKAHRKRLEAVASSTPTETATQPVENRPAG
ncbi:MAG: hypothetical protein Rubg2KO_34770 [Rubricoccaceae bacterium]